MQVYVVMMKFDYFKRYFVLFGIGYEYQDVYDNLDELKSDCNGWICEEKIETK